jgi:lysyl-tRNA synthetase class I
MNRVYLRKTPWGELQRYLRSFPEGHEIDAYRVLFGEERFSRLWSLAAEEASDLRELLSTFLGLAKRPERVELTEEHLEVLAFLRRATKEMPVWEDEEGVKGILKIWQKESGVKPAVFYKTLRLLLIGREEGPELHRLLLALGKEEFLKRLGMHVEGEVP